MPGAFGAWLDLLARYGTLPLADVLAPAIGYARDGYPLVPDAADTISAVADLFADHWPSSAAVYLPAPAPGARFTQPRAGRHARRGWPSRRAPGEQQIEAARRAFYEGFVAEAVDAFVVGTAVLDSSGREHTGFLRGSDLAAWRATEEPTVSVRFAGRTVHKTAAWGQGPVLLQQLAMLEALGHHPATPTRSTSCTPSSRWPSSRSPTARPGTATCRTSRSSHAAVDRLRRRPRPARRRDRRRGPAARLPRRPHAAAGREPVGGRTSSGTAARASASRSTTARSPSGDTCHVDVVDRWGNRVSATPSGGWLQSSPVVPGLGFSLPTRAQMFWLEPGLPAQPRARAVAPAPP